MKLKVSDEVGVLFVFHYSVESDNTTFIQYTSPLQGAVCLEAFVRFALLDVDSSKVVGNRVLRD